VHSSGESQRLSAQATLDGETLHAVFEHWMEKLEWLSQNMVIPIHDLNIR
jgi:hypothetical protein